MTKIGNSSQLSKQASPKRPSPFPSSSSQTLKYRIAIKEPEEWKIQAIAQYKRKQRLKQLLEEQIKLKQEEKNQAVKKSLSKSQGAKPMSQEVREESTLPKEEDIRNAYESHVRELANCHFTGAVAKARIAALHSVRGSLLWLLKKASLHERALIQDHLQPLNQHNP